MFDRSGEQVTLSFGDMRVVVCDIGATLRSFRAQDIPIIWEFSPDEIASAGRGQVLAPWPNRLEDGTFDFEGTHATAALDEPDKHNAIHGIVRWLSWGYTQDEDDRVTFRCVIVPQPAYPYRVSISVTYALSEHGLTVTTSARNDDVRRAPFGIGFHPYLVPRGSLDEASLSVPARRHLLLDQRGLPTGSDAVTDASIARRAKVDRGLSWSRLEGVTLDECFTDLERDADGLWHTVFDPCGPGDQGVEVWGDGAFGYLMCFTGDTFAPDLARQGLAIEPMTCPPNALSSGTDLVVLDPGASFVGSWGIDLRQAAP